MMVEPDNIRKLFLNFSNFEPQYSYRLYSYKKKSVAMATVAHILRTEGATAKRLSFNTFKDKTPSMVICGNVDAS